MTDKIKDPDPKIKRTYPNVQIVWRHGVGFKLATEDGEAMWISNKVYDALKLAAECREFEEVVV